VLSTIAAKVNGIYAHRRAKSTNKYFDVLNKMFVLIFATVVEVTFVFHNNSPRHSGAFFRPTIKEAA